MSPNDSSMKKQMKDILKKGTYKVNGRLWIESKDTSFLGPGPVELLEHIEAEGSIKQAAKKMGMSYKKAWTIVDRLNTMSARPLIITTTGGERGGGSSISDDAKQMIKYYRLLRERFNKFLEQESKRFQ